MGNKDTPALCTSVRVKAKQSVVCTSSAFRIHPQLLCSATAMSSGEKSSIRPYGNIAALMLAKLGIAKTALRYTSFLLSQSLRFCTYGISLLSTLMFFSILIVSPGDLSWQMAECPLAPLSVHCAFHSRGLLSCLAHSEL